MVVEALDGVFLDHVFHESPGGFSVAHFGGDSNSGLTLRNASQAISAHKNGGSTRTSNLGVSQSPVVFGCVTTQAHHHYGTCYE